MTLEEAILAVLGVAVTIIGALLGIVWNQLTQRLGKVDEALVTAMRDSRDDRHSLRDLIGVIVNEQNVKNIEFARELGRLTGRDHGGGDFRGGGGHGRSR